MNPTASIALAATTAIVGSLFAAADAAVTSISDPRLDVLAQTERPFARYEKGRTTVLARWLVGRVSSIGLSAVMFDDAFEHLFDLSMPLAPAAATVLVYATFAEVLGSIARQRPEATARRFLVWLWPLEMVVAVIAMPLSLLGRFVTSQVDEERVHDPVSAEAELENAVTGLEESGTIAEEPAAMIRNVLEFQEQTAKEVMVPRRLMAGIELKTPLSEVIELVAKDGHSRYPVYRETLDNVVGLLYVKDLFDVVRTKKVETLALSALLRKPVLFVAASQPILTVLREMRSKRLHLAVVADEYGGTAGMVTLEDIIEEIVGDIRDEYDVEADAPIQSLGEGRYLANASIPLADLADHIGNPLPTEGTYESLGGLLVDRAGRVPEVGEVVRIGDLRLTVREADETRVTKVEIALEAPEEPAT
ncbi:MAG: hemolysin family protein [Polyangiaceae bacterium]